MVETPIAHRVLQLTRADGTTSDVRVEIGLPERDDNGMYSCDYSIEGLEESIELRQPGLDAIDALERTLIEIGRLLAETPEVSEGRVEWPGGAADELGFPIALAKARV